MSYPSKGAISRYRKIILTNEIAHIWIVTEWTNLCLDKINHSNRVHKKLANMRFGYNSNTQPCPSSSTPSRSGSARTYWRATHKRWQSASQAGGCSLMHSHLRWKFCSINSSSHLHLCQLQVSSCSSPRYCGSVPRFIFYQKRIQLVLSLFAPGSWHPFLLPSSHNSTPGSLRSLSLPSSSAQG